MTESATIASLGKRIRDARIAADFTIARLASEMGVDPRTVAGWQAGRSAPSYARLVELARLLERPPSYFLDGGE